MASIYKRGQQFWIRYRDPSGALVQKNLKCFNNNIPVKNITLAKFIKNEVENKIYTEKPLAVASTSVEEAKAKYYTHCEKRLSKSTVSIYKIYINNFINTQKPKSLMSITEASVNAYLDQKDISNRTANHTIKILKQFLNYCKRQNLIPENPILDMKTFRVEVKQPRFLSKEEIRALFTAAQSTDLYSMIATAIYTGMRLGELKRLEWDDIDLNRNQITVKIAKSKRFRVLPIHPDLLPVLSAQQGTEKVFETTNLQQRFANFKKDVKLPDIGWHTFRHTFASHLVMSGVDIVTVSKLLGHSSINVTMVYAHLAKDHIKESVKALRF